jgi:putative endonuclease
MVILKRLKRWMERLWPWRSISTGEQGERWASSFLEKRGYTILAKNWRNPHDRRDEIDLVCRDGDVVVFVEVKTRAAAALVQGYFAVDQRKKKALRRAATAYLRLLRPAPSTYRFDMVEVSMTPSAPPEIRHFENGELFTKGFRP